MAFDTIVTHNDIQKGETLYKNLQVSTWNLREKVSFEEKIMAVNHFLANSLKV